MLFIRSALIVGVGILFVPTDAAQQAEFKKNVAAVTGYAAAFCERNPTACQKGGEYWVIFKKKAEVAGGMAFDAAKDRFLGAMVMPASQSTSPVAAPVPKALEQPSPRPARVTTGSLRQDDLAPAWRGARG